MKFILLLLSIFQKRIVRLANWLRMPENFYFVKLCFLLLIQLKI
jgi:hypothetical protein